MRNNHTPTAEELKLQLEEERQLNNLLQEKVNRFIQMGTQIFMVHSRFLSNVGEPHYLTNAERELYAEKGLDALYIHWRKEIRKIDHERMKKYDFPLPK